MNQSPVYDIRTSANALTTLVNLTGVSTSIWENSILQRNKYQYEDDLVEDVIRNYGHFPADYEDWIFIYFHITTSANQCTSFKRHGILDLVHAYQCNDSELREFLDAHDIKIDIDSRTLSYKKQIYDISYGRCPSPVDVKAYTRWAIGKKFYYDFTTCGFLSVWNGSPYGGYVHRRPEILSDIDDLLNSTLSHEWRITHEPYEIVAAAPGTDIVYNGDDRQSSKDKIMNYLTKAYTTAFGSPSEEIVLLKNGVQIPPDRIIDIKPLNYW